jgi:hypothetical protein
VKLRRPIACSMALGLMLGLNGGCLSLNMLNREAPDTKQRLASLEQRVSALETRPIQTAAVPAPPQQIAPGPSPSMVLLGNAHQ